MRDGRLHLVDQGPNEGPDRQWGGNRTHLLAHNGFTRCKLYIGALQNDHFLRAEDGLWPTSMGTHRPCEYCLSGEPAPQALRDYGTLRLYTVYSSSPREFVVRESFIYGPEVTQGKIVLRAHTLYQIRGGLLAQDRIRLRSRNDLDDPALVEVWI